MDFFQRLFDSSDFNPRNTCGSGWSSGLVWAHIVSDCLIWLSYLAIPVVLIYFVRKRRDIPFSYLFWLFGAFILSCGTTHLVGMLMFSAPMYRLDALIKILTALVSVATVIALIPMAPKLLAMRSPKELEAEIAERNRVQKELQALNATLEEKVRARTTELERQTYELALANDRLRKVMDEQKRSEAVLAERAADLARSNADLEQFAYVASHDLREPLRMVISYVQLLEKRYKGKLDAQADKYIHYASDGATRMYKLIDDLLAYARAGRMEDSKQDVELAEVMADVRGSLKTAIDESKAEIVVPEALPKVKGNRAQLTQLLQNLIANAIKFKGDEPPKITVEARPMGKEWVVAVCDNGEGFDPQFSSHLFRMFNRLHNDDKHPGSGIGLAIAKKIVERHGGRIWGESEPGKGANFFFTIPVTA